MDHYVDPSWATLDTASGGVDENIFAGLPDFAKEPLFLEPLPFDLGSYVTPMSTENPSISTKDIFSPVAPQPLASTSAERAASTNNGFDLSLSNFSDSASPADSHSPSQSASAQADEPHTESEDDSDDQDAEDDFMSRKKSTSTRGRVPSASAKSKRAANKPKPYPRVSDVVRDAPHRVAAIDSKRQPATTELKGSVRTGEATEDDWRPTMEEYQKMSSKEKRQLRNKISARNFRVRRKEYITTLEDEVAVRDQQLETYREELTSTKSENSELRKEIERLRKEIMEGRAGGSIFDTPAPESKATVLAQTNGRATRGSKNVVARPNRNKDLPSSGSTRGFWGGATLGGTTPVHTTLIPDFDISTLSGKPRNLQENLNPLLNLAPANREDNAPHLPLFTSGLDGLHNFTLKGLDTDRMQLWSRMAREAGAAQAAREKLAIASPTSSLNSTAGSSGYSPPSALSQLSVSPLFLLSPAKAGSQASGKEVSNALTPTASQAVLATSITNSVTNKLMGALWGAFAPKQTLDLDKVKRVLEGKAELRVVDVEKSSAAALEEGIKAMNIGRLTPKPEVRKNSVEALEEGLKSMSLASNRLEATMAHRKECGKLAAATAASSVALFQRPMRAGHSPTPVHQPSSKQTVTAQH